MYNLRVMSHRECEKLKIRMMNNLASMKISTELNLTHFFSELLFPAKGTQDSAFSFWVFIIDMSISERERERKESIMFLVNKHLFIGSCP